MSALSLLQALIKEIEALPVIADHPTTFQPAAGGGGDAAWGPRVPPGHSEFSWGVAPSPSSPSSSSSSSSHSSKVFTLRHPQEMAARAQQAADALIAKPEEKKHQHQQKGQQKDQPQEGKDDKQGGKGKGQQQQQGGKGQQQQQQQGKGGQQQQGGKGGQQQQQQGGKGGQQQQQGGKGKGQQQQQQQGGKAAVLDPRSAFYEIDIRVGKITKAWDHPKADKLYVELIDIGEQEPRQVLSGLRQSIPIDQFVGSDCLVIVNLKPAVMMEITSYGMVLAAKKENKIELVKPPKGAPVGARVFLQGEEDVEWPEAAEQVDARKKGSSWTVVGPLLKTNAEGLVCLGDKPLAVADGPLRSTITNGVVS